jgi:hypothetical protein
MMWIDRKTKGDRTMNQTELTPQELRAMVLRQKAEYQRAWSRANRDKVKKYQRDYWIRKALRAYEQQKGEDGK